MEKKPSITTSIIKPEQHYMSLLNGEKIRIAIIDDDEDDFFLLSEFINSIEGKEFIIDWFKDYDTALQVIRDKAYHLYFVDYFLGAKTGLDLLKDASTMNLNQPIILLTGFGSRSIDIQAMEFGATDYLVKSELGTEKVERCIRYALERAVFLGELKASEVKYRAVFEGSKDAVFIADPHLVFAEVNPAGSLLLESKNGVLLGRSLYEFISDNVQKARIRDLVKTSGNIDDLEIRISGNGNEVKNCLLSLYVHQNAEQQPVVHGIIHDITNIKKAELSNLQAEKLAANERLIRMLAHEIRNPLNNITLSVEQLLSEPHDETEKNFLSIIQRNSGRINNIIKELLNLASPAELVFENHPLQEIMDQSLEHALDRINLNNIQLEKRYHSRPLVVPVDKNQLVIAFTNILINAIEAMEINKGVLAVSLEEDSGVFRVLIRDNGRGIPNEYLSKLFDPFFTLKKGGVGLGLTASYSIIQSHKANMQVQSRPDEGTTFIISFNAA